jgi:hypothetical protein
MKNEELKITIPDFHYSLLTIHSVGLSAFDPMLHSLCPALFLSHVTCPRAVGARPTSNVFFHRGVTL